MQQFAQDLYLTWPWPTKRVFVGGQKPWNVWYLIIQLHHQRRKILQVKQIAEKTLFEYFAKVLSNYIDFVKDIAMICQRYCHDFVREISMILSKMLPGFVKDIAMILTPFPNVISGFSAVPFPSRCLSNGQLYIAQSNGCEFIEYISD